MTQEEKFSSYIGLVVTQLRKENNWTQWKFCKVSGHSPATYSRIEKGDFNFGVRNLFKIAAVYNINPAFIIDKAYYLMKYNGEKYD